MQILLLDTQGFGTDNKDINDDSRIFTLAILLSRYKSLFIKFIKYIYMCRKYIILT